MTGDSEIERILDHWFTERPGEVADRVLDDVADRIGRQPQRPAWRAWTDSHVFGNVKPSAAIAAVIILALVGFVVLGWPSDSGVGGPVHSPAPATGPSPTHAPSSSVGVAGACDLMTSVEAGDALHITSAVSAQSLVYFDTSAVTRFPSAVCWFHTAGATSLFVLVYNKENGADTFAIWQRSTGVEAVSGLGDGAVWNPLLTTLYILKGDRLVTIEPLGASDPKLTLEAVKAIGAIVAGRM